MKYYLPKGADLKAAMEKGLIVPKNFLGGLECTRPMTKKEASQWEIYRMSKAREISGQEEQLE